MTKAEPIFLDIVNYKIVKEAHIEVSDLTLIRGQNDSGKSSFFQGLHTAIANESSDAQISYGAKSFTVRMGIGSRSLSYSRKKGAGPVVSIDGGEPLDKLGRLSLSDIDPTFPLKALKFPLANGEAEKFYPNFVFQEELPVFGQVDVYAFFSAMFEPVARVSRHLYAVRKRVSDASSNTSAVKAQSNSLLEMFNSLNASLTAIDEPTVVLCHGKVVAGLQVAAEVTGSLAKINGLEQRLAALSKYAALDGNDFNLAADHYQSLDKVKVSLQEVVSKRKALEKTSHDFSAAQAYHEMLPKAKSLLEMSRTSFLLSDLRLKTDSVQSLGVRLEQAARADKVVEWLSQVKTSYDLLTGLQSKVTTLNKVATRWAKKEMHVRYLEAWITPYVSFGQTYACWRSSRAASLETLSKIADTEKTLSECRAELATIAECPVCGGSLTKPLHEHVGGLHG